MRGNAISRAARRSGAAGTLAPLGKAKVMTGFAAGFAGVGPIGQRVKAGGHAEPVEGVQGVGCGIYAERGGKASVAVECDHGWFGSGPHFARSRSRGACRGQAAIETTSPLHAS